MSESTARRIIGAVCNEYRNSDLRADNPEIRQHLDAEFERLQQRVAALENGIDSLLRATGRNAASIDLNAAVPLLEATFDHLRGRVSSLQSQLTTAQDEARRLREALEFYASAANYREYTSEYGLIERAKVPMDRGWMARVALAASPADTEQPQEGSNADR